MIAFGSSITAPDVYERCAGRGFGFAGEPDSEVIAQPAQGSIFRSYNLILQRAAGYDDLEALVLAHQDVEIVDPEFCAKVRRVLSDPDAGVIGCVGAIGVRSIAWWEGRVTWASSVYRSEEHGMDFPAWIPDGWSRTDPSDAFRTGEVDTVDGVLMAFSPWAVRNVRFDESLGPIYGFDFDFCMQVRAAGRKVVTENLRVAHPYPLAVVKDPDTWIEAHMTAADKWDGRLPNASAEEVDWHRRARRAEGEAAAARLLSATKMYEIQALTWKQERELEAATDSLSWRITAPLRQVNALRKQRARRNAPTR